MPIYGEVLARNIRAARSRINLGQAAVAARMSALGFRGWHPQTVSSTEKARRRVTVEEIFALSEALETSVGALMAPVDDDKIVGFPSGAAVPVDHVRHSVRGRNDGAVQWDGDTPVFPEPLSTAKQLAAAGIADWTVRSQSEVKDFDHTSGELVRREGGQH